jgi:hypothetical protein
MDRDPNQGYLSLTYGCNISHSFEIKQHKMKKSQIQFWKGNKMKPLFMIFL